VKPAESLPDRDAELPAIFIGFLLVAVFFSSPLILGRSRLRYRDLGTTQAPAAALQREIGLASVNPRASFGQPFRGNPNLLVYYRAPISWTSVESHLVLHWLLGLAGMYFFLRSLALSKHAAGIGAIAFSCSGYVLSSLSFLNASTTIGLLPWVLWAAVSDRRRRVIVPLLCALMALFSISGEPALIALGVVLALCVAARKSLRHAGWFLAGALGGILLTLPIHVETWRAARDSARIVRGFTFAQAAEQSLHPMRLVEWLVPGIFGSPTNLLRGAWWGFRYSDGALPYIFCLTIAFVPLLLLLLRILTGARTVDRFWSAVFAVAIVAAAFGHLPFAERLYRMLGDGVLRYPIKFFLIATIAAVVLGAQAFDFWAGSAPSPSRAKAVRVATAIAVLAAGTGFVAATGPMRVMRVLRIAWDERWRSDPAVVLGPIVDAIPLRLLFLAGMAAATAAMIARPRPGRRTIVALLVVVDAMLLAPPLIPRVPASRLEERSPLLVAAAALPGPVCELTAKDIDPVRRGLMGRYYGEGRDELAVTQFRQAWATSGAPYGVRYAYNNSPDGSYTYRNQLVQEALQNHGTWDYVLRWLRASGVSGLIAPPIAGVAGLTEIAREDAQGVPAVLYRIPDALPSVRRRGDVVWASSPQQALEMFGRSSFDPMSQLVLEGVPRPLTGGTGSAKIIEEGADRMVVRSAGAGAQMLFVARTFTSRASAVINGAPVPLLPANVHLIAVPVPAGESTIAIRF
jgi:hypothetical protein